MVHDERLAMNRHRLAIAYENNSNKMLMQKREATDV